MERNRHDLHLLHLTGDERQSFEEKRWIFVFLTLVPLIGMTATYAVQVKQVVREPFVIYSYPVMAPVMLGAVLWNLLGGYSRLAERITVVVVTVLAVLHNLSFALQPTLPESPSFVGSASYWTLVLHSCVILLILPPRQAARLVGGLYVVCMSLPWLLNADTFQPYLAAMVRAQGGASSVLLAILCLSWYRQRYVERAQEALMLRQLAVSDLFAAPDPDRAAP